MKKLKKIALSIQAIALLLGVTLPVHAAINVGTPTYYSNYYSNNSVVSIGDSKTPTYSVPTKTNSVVKIRNTNFSYPYYYYFYTQPTTPSKPSTPAPTPTQPTTPTKPSTPAPTPTQPTTPTKPSTPAPTPTQPTAPTQPSTPAEQPSNTALSTQEQAMVNAINKERAGVGLPALKADLEVSKVARVKANDMKTNNYFSHTSPTYGSPFDMMKSFGINYRSAGENIAMNYSVDAAMTAFMNSEGHRANILNSSYTHVGIGIVGNYYVQMFISK